MDYTCYPKLKRYTKKAVAISSGNRSWTWVLKLDSFIPGRNAIQPLWNTRDLFHTFSDFKKVSDKVWQTRLCVVRDAKLQYTKSLDRLVMETLHNTSKNAERRTSQQPTERVLSDNSEGSSVLLNSSIRNFMGENFDNHHTSIFMSARLV